MHGQKKSAIGGPKTFGNATALHNPGWSDDKRGIGSLIVGGEESRSVGRDGGARLELAIGDVLESAEMCSSSGLGAENEEHGGVRPADMALDDQGEVANPSLLVAHHHLLFPNLLGPRVRGIRVRMLQIVVVFLVFLLSPSLPPPAL